MRVTNWVISVFLVAAGGLAGGPAMAGAAPTALVVTPESLDFGEQPIRQFATWARGVDLENGGMAAINVTSISLSGPDADQFTAGNVSDACRPVPAAGHCDAHVYFNPGTTGPKQAVLLIGTDDSETPISVPLSGIGGPENNPRIELSPESLDFGKATIGTVSPARELTISSTGTRPLSFGVNPLEGPGADDFTVDASACGLDQLPVGESCSVKVTFNPTSLGEKSTAIAIGHNAFTGSFVPLTGEAVPPATLEIRAAAKVRKGKKLSVSSVIENSGVEPLNDVVLTTEVPGKLARAPKRVTIATVPVGATVKKTIRVPVRRTAKRGKKLTVRVRAEAGGESLTSARTVARVR